MNTNRNKTAIVTGGSRGIGAAIVMRLADDGFTVVINYADSAREADGLVEKIEAKGGRAIAAQADVSDPVAVARMFDAAQAAFGGIDVLVNNAGIMKLATIADSDDALFDRQVATNLKGTFNTLREAAKRLCEGGRIVNLSSSDTSTMEMALSGMAGRSGNVTMSCHSELLLRSPTGAPTKRTLTKPSRATKNGGRPLRTSAIWFVTTALVFVACCFILIYPFMAIWGASAFAWPVFAVLMLKAAFRKARGVR